MSNAETKPLNKLEVWVAEHAVPIFAVIAVAIVVGAAAVIYTYSEQSGIAERVKVLAPKVTRVSKAICDQESLHHLNRARSCAERIRVGLVNCRKVPRCRAAFLAIATYPPPARSSAPSSTTAITTAPDQKGGATQQPSSHGHQQPGPSGGQHQEGSQEASPAPSGPPAPERGPPAETPGNGAPGAPGGSSSSGAGVEVCALERTCVGVEVGADPKGLLP
jgi:hypothetical protein